MSKVSKSICLIICISLILSSFCGCEKLSTELSDMMIIQGVGIDKVGGTFKTTIEILNNEQSGSSGGDNMSDEKTKVYSGTGETVSAAIRSVISKNGKMPLFAHLRVIVIGEETARTDMSELLDFFARDYNTRADVPVCIAKGLTAEEIITANLSTDLIKSETLRNILFSSAEMSEIQYVRILDAVNTMLDETSCMYIPAVLIEQNGQNVCYKLEGSALFDYENTFITFLDSNTTKSLVLLNNKIKKGAFTVKTENSVRASFLIVNGKVKYDITVEDGILVYNVKIKLSCDLNEFDGGIKSRETVDELKTSLEKKVESELLQAMSFIQGNKNIDAVRFGRRLLKRDKETFFSVSDNWRESFGKIKTNVNAEVTIRRIGEKIV